MRRPAVVWFGEEIPHEALSRAKDAVEAAGLLLAVGTSAHVFRAAGLLWPAAWSLRAPAGRALPELVEAACRGEG